MGLERLVHVWLACAGRYQDRRSVATEVYFDQGTKRQQDQQLGEQVPLQAEQLQAVELRVKISVALVRGIQGAMVMLSCSSS